MPYQTLYRAFRPQSLEEVCGQQTVTRVLSRQLETGRISHAYLFCGSRGTGTTSTAKAFARVLSCLHPEGSRACGACEACRQSNNMDIVEIDAASNNGVDEIRDLRERVKYPPVNGRYKIYIIDEVHMLSTAAFNALLKTLEEPPEHVVFILATTEPRRLPATILSRCQRYDFRRISAQVIVARMREILAQIGASAEDEALELIAQSAEGGMRDALSLLDMCLSYAEGALTAQAVRDVTGSAGRSFLFEYTQALANMDAAAALQLIDRLVRDGRDLASFASEEGDHLRALLLAKFAPEAVAELLEVSEETAQRYREQSAPIGENRLVQLTELFLEAQSRMKYLSSARAALELCSVRACRPAEGVDMESVLARLEALEAMPRAAAPRAEESQKTGPAAVSEEIGAFAEGSYTGIEKVNDPTFSQKILGDGAAIVPEDNRIYAPADAVVEMVADTKHAVALRTKAGNGILLHVGIDTVQLGGKYFTLHVSQGQSVKKGDCLMEVDFEKIAGEGYDTTICLIFAELAEGCHVEREAERHVAVGDKIAVIAG